MAFIDTYSETAAAEVKAGEHVRVLIAKSFGNNLSANEREHGVEAIVQSSSVKKEMLRIIARTGHGNSRDFAIPFDMVERIEVRGERIGGSSASGNAAINAAINPVPAAALR